MRCTLLGMSLALVLGTLSPLRAEPSEGVAWWRVPEPFGVNIHFVVPKEEEVDALAAVGYRVIRMDFSWGGTERKKGEYDFSGYDKLVESMSRRGIRCLFILDYGNRLYDNGTAPHSPEAQAAFAKWAGAAAKHFAGKGILWEIWNEPNLAQFWKPKPDAEAYCRLSHATIDAIRQADPQAYILGPASSGFPWAFFEVMAQRGVFGRLDAVSVHPYRQTAPETAEADYHRLRLLLDRASPNKHLRILSGEWGYSTGWKNLTEEKQSQYIVRQWLFNMSHDVGLSIWYDWKDDGSDPKEPEHHFGSVYRDLKLKPSAKAAQTLANTLRGYSFRRRLVTDNPKDYLLLFSDAGKLAVAGWTVGEAHSVRVPLPARPAKIVGMLGETRAATADEGGVALELSGWPQYVLADAGAASGGAWGPSRSINAIRARAEAQVPVTIESPLEGRLEVVIDGHVIGSKAVNIGRGNAQTTFIPIRIDHAPQPTLGAEVRFVGQGGATQTLERARITLLITNNLTASVLPPAQGALTVLVDNPSGDAVEGTLSAVAGQTKKTAALKLDKGQTQAAVVVEAAAEAGGKAIGVEATDAAGRLILRAEPVRWQPMPLGQEAWSAATEGDAKVAAAAKVALADAPANCPQAGLASAIRVDYRFGDGWRYALIAPPAARSRIEGKPKALGLWIYGDGSGNTLRCRFRDSADQTFQPTLGPIDWTGWKWITLPIDGTDASHFGGANDGVVHYPIRWNSLLLIDNAKLKNDQELRIYATGFALRY